MKVTQDSLREYFFYDGKNLVNKKYRQSLHKKNIGKVAGFVDQKGYRVIKLGGKAYKAHRLIWLYHFGKWPTEIDHINRDRSDNRLENLRECDRFTNMRNLRIGCGVTKARNKYKARLGQKHLGHFDTFDEALAARKKAERVYWNADKTPLYS